MIKFDMILMTVFHLFQGVDRKGPRSNYRAEFNLTVPIHPSPSTSFEADPRSLLSPPMAQGEHMADQSRLGNIETCHRIFFHRIRQRFFCQTGHGSKKTLWLDNFSLTCVNRPWQRTKNFLPLLNSPVNHYDDIALYTLYPPSIGKKLDFFYLTLISRQPWGLWAFFMVCTS